MLVGAVSTLGYQGRRSELHFLGDLVGPEAESSTGAVNNDIGTQATEDACLVILARLEVGDDSIVRVSQRCAASWARCRLVTSSTRQPKSSRTITTEYVTAKGGG